MPDMLKSVGLFYALPVVLESFDSAKTEPVSSPVHRSMGIRSDMGGVNGGSEPCGQGTQLLQSSVLGLSAEQFGIMIPNVIWDYDAKS
jgi:hypothetical protein